LRGWGWQQKSWPRAANTVGSFNCALKNKNSNNTINDILECLFKVAISNKDKQHAMIQIIKVEQIK